MAGFEELFRLIREDCHADVWSAAVRFSREAQFVIDHDDDQCVEMRIIERGRAVSPRVVLWKLDLTWESSIDEDEDPGRYVVAAAIAYKNGIGLRRAAEGGKSGIDLLGYNLYAREGFLCCERFTERDGHRKPFRGSLLGFSGAGEGRVDDVQLAPTADDYAIERILKQSPGTAIGAEQMAELLHRLSQVPLVEYQGKKIKLSAESPKRALVISADDRGYRIRFKEQLEEIQSFKNAAFFDGNTLRPKGEKRIEYEEAAAFEGEGSCYSEKETAFLFGEVLPRLEKVFCLEFDLIHQPVLRKEKPRVVVELSAEGESLSVLPRIVYGDPPIAELVKGRLKSIVPGEFVCRDLSEEHRLKRKLQLELHLDAGVVRAFTGDDAVGFRAKLDDWELSGERLDDFLPRGVLQGEAVLSEESFSLSFKLPGGRGSSSIEQVLEAWSQGRSFLFLADGNWASLPKDWLEKYGERALEILRKRDSDGKLPVALLPTAAAFVEESSVGKPDAGLKSLLQRFVAVSGNVQAELPSDLRAELRVYQRQGINWLSFLREAGVGALLADDMGLGKTLQTLCVLRGNSLVVCPTSVMYAWLEQTAKFRPALRVCCYHGSERALLPDAELTITTYGVLRLEKDKLSQITWDTLVLDEAQTIKNPDSQAARAAYELKARFKIALSGTPVENRSEDLWSLFHFLNPEVLGDRAVFQRKLAPLINAETKGQAGRAENVLLRVKPFILRRLKEDVERELPPRTEQVLRCELWGEEREAYEVLLSSARREVVAKLEKGLGIFSGLEILLRLRQACCHRGLLPGEVAENSSKIELLLDSLESALAYEHKALVFSQWTSFLDLIEPHLRSAGIGFLRLDGSTRDRNAIVQSFQEKGGPPLMLVSLKAGGTGITLTQADHVYFMDPWWNPATEQQAADRVHRIGQTKPVFIYKIAARGTVEEKVLELQEHKRELANKLLQAGEGGEGLSREDIISLLS